METNRQPESEEVKLRQQLEEFLRYARVLEEVTRAPANLPRVKEVPRRSCRCTNRSCPARFSPRCFAIQKPAARCRSSARNWPNWTA